MICERVMAMLMGHMERHMDVFWVLGAPVALCVEAQIHSVYVVALAVS